MNYNFLKNSYIPENDVKLMLLDGTTPEIILNKLTSLNIDFILTTPCNLLNSPIAFHPDIQIFPLGGNNIAAAPNNYDSINQKLSEYGFNVIKGFSSLKSNYPEDIAYNVAGIGDICFHKIKYTDPIIKEWLTMQGKQLINVNQGYSKCSTAIINSKAIITSDKSIHNAAEKFGVASLLITPGYIKLKGLNYGFIGGCTGLIAPNVLAVTGSLKNHPDYYVIQSFLKKQNAEMICLSDQIPCDIGSLIPLLEK